MKKLSPSKLRDSSLSEGCLVGPKTCGIYYICHKESGKYYVGSSVDVLQRMRAHFSDLLKGSHHSTKLQNSFNKHTAEGFSWGLLERVSDQSRLHDREQEWIDKSGWFNVGKVAGSPKGVKHDLPQEERDRRRAWAIKMNLNKSPDEIREAVRRAADSKRGVPLSDEQKEKIRNSTKGRPLAPEHRLKLTEINKSRTVSEGALKGRGEAIRKALANRTDEQKAAWKAALSESRKGAPSPNKGKTASVEARAKMRAAKLGGTLSDAHKEKLRQAMLNKPDEWYEARAEKVRKAKARK